MLLELRLDHSALKAEAEKRGYEEQSFTELMVCQVPGYQMNEIYSKEPWALLGIDEFVYCNEVLTVELAAIEGRTLIIYHDCDRYPESPVRVPIKSIRSQEKKLNLSGCKPLCKNDQI